MCFGNTQTSSTTNTPTPNAAVAQGATQNLNFAENLQNQGFTPYTGQQVANLSPGQSGTINAALGIANNGTGNTAQADINQYASAPAQNVQANTISSAMSPYMNQYVMQALAPQLQQMNIANAATNQQADAQATSSGAFGDARAGIQASNNAFNQNVQQEGVIGNAYNNAFNTAIGAGAQDVSNNLSAQNSNAGYNEQMLNRVLGGATAGEGLQTQQLGSQTTANTLAQQQTAQQQAGLTAQYNQWLMAQQYPFQTAGLLNQTVGAGASAMPASTTSTTSQPNNSGWALGGAVLGGLAGNSGLGTAAGLAMFSDVNLKEDVDRVGELADGTPVYTYRYKGDPVTRLGLMAQDIDYLNPDADAVIDIAGFKAVDYAKATERSSAIARAF